MSRMVRKMNSTKKIFLLFIILLGIGGTTYYITQIKPMQDFVKSEGQLGEDTQNKANQAAPAMFVIASTALNNQNDRSVDVENYLDSLIEGEHSTIEYSISKDQHSWDFIFNKKAKLIAAYDDELKKWKFELIDLESNEKINGQSYSMAEVTEGYKILSKQGKINPQFTFIEK